MGKREDADNVGALEIDHQRKTATLYGNPIDFSKTEFELLSLLVSNPGRVFSKEELLESIWPKDEPAGTKAVDASIKDIRAKLGDVAGHITLKPGFGYYFE